MAKMAKPKPTAVAMASPRPATARSPTGVILAGGPSTRLGRDKTRLEIEMGERTMTLVDWAIERTSAVCGEVLVAARRPASEPAMTTASSASTTTAAVASIADGPGRGPAAGILGAALARPGRSLLVLACDLPLVPVALLRRIAALDEHPDATTGGEGKGQPSKHDWLVPARQNWLEPTCALYRPPALEALARRVERGRNDLHGLAEEPGVRTRRLGEIELDLASRRTTSSKSAGNQPQEERQWRDIFLNLNELRDVERFEQLRHDPLLWPDSLEQSLRSSLDSAF